jgi:hypothetical protein
MRNARILAVAATGVALAVAVPGRGLAAGAGPFDGLWNVEVDCASVGEVEGYNWRFPAEVSSGFMSGLYRSPTNSAIGHITGRILPDGEAHLSMFGRTGPEKFAVDHERPGAPFRYTVDAHFDGNSGSGKRNERRACALTFARS